MRIIKSHLIAQMSDIKTEILCTIISLQTFEKKNATKCCYIYTQPPSLAIYKTSNQIMFSLYAKTLTFKN